MSGVDCAFTVTGGGPPVIMVHGIGARRAGWQGLVDRLKNDFLCVTYDLRGHGASPAPPPPYTLDDLVADLEALRARLGIERVHVVGHSLGGMIGPAYARAHPRHVASLGLLSTAAFRTEDDRAKVQAVIAAIERDGLDQVLPTLVGRWYTDAFAAARPDAVAARLQQVKDTPLDVFLSVFRLYAVTEMAPWLPEVAAPSLVLTGALDGGCNPRLNRQVAAALPNAELVILDGLKHSILIEAPDRVAEAVRGFLLRQGL